MFNPGGIDNGWRLCASVWSAYSAGKRPQEQEKWPTGVLLGDRGLHTVFKDIVHLRRLLHLRLAGTAVAHDVLPRLGIGEDELVGRDPYHLAVLAVQLEDVEGEPARHEAVAVADARSTHPERAGVLAQRVEEDIEADMAQEVADELGPAARVSCGIVSGAP